MTRLSRNMGEVDEPIGNSSSPVSFDIASTSTTEPISTAQGVFTLSYNAHVNADAPIGDEFPKRCFVAIAAGGLSAVRCRMSRSFSSCFWGGEQVRLMGDV